MEIQVGDYVRTKQGYIGKYNKSVDGYDEFTDNEGTFYFDVEHAKHSKNIIDLIEDEDIVILEYYVRKYGKRIQRRFEVVIIDETIRFENAHCDFHYDTGNKKWWNDAKGYNPQIKSIVTHQSFKQVEYIL